MTFLPEKFRRAQEEPGTHFPADDVGPLVDEERQVGSFGSPFVGVPDNGFARGPNDERFFEFRLGVDDDFAIDGFETVMGDDGAFLGEAGRRVSLPGSGRKGG